MCKRLRNQSRAPSHPIQAKVEIFLKQREVAFLSPSKICKNLNFSREILLGDKNATYLCSKIIFTLQLKHKLLLQNWRNICLRYAEWLVDSKMVGETIPKRYLFNSLASKNASTSLGFFSYIHFWILRGWLELPLLRLLTILDSLCKSHMWWSQWLWPKSL